MKKILFSFLIIFPAFLTVRAQSYALQLTNNDLACYLDIFESGKYLIKLSHKNAPDLVISQPLSFGKYTVEDNGNYTLTDGTNQYVITLEPVTGNKIFMVKDGFRWMQLNYFAKSSDKPSSPVSISTDFLSRSELLSYREKIRIDKNIYKNKFRNGFYQSDFNPEFTFRAHEDGTYSIRFYSLELSNGTWEKEDNFLKLKDDNLAAYFFVAVEPEDKLKSILMPGDFSLTRFSKVS